MFLDELSVSLLQIGEEENLSYEKIAEKCDLSSKFVGNVIRRKSVPSITSLEKMCTAFNCTPNDILRISQKQAEYRSAMPVEEFHQVPFENGTTCYPICPRCGGIIDREYQEYCDQCGQRLGWNDIDKATVVDVSKSPREKYKKRKKK